jgi:hypothetical protein
MRLSEFFGRDARGLWWSGRRLPRRNFLLRCIWERDGLPWASFRVLGQVVAPCTGLASCTGVARASTALPPLSGILERAP